MKLKDKKEDIKILGTEEVAWQGARRKRVIWRYFGDFHTHETKIEAGREYSEDELKDIILADIKKKGGAGNG